MIRVTNNINPTIISKNNPTMVILRTSGYETAPNIPLLWIESVFPWQLSLPWQY